MAKYILPNLPYSYDALEPHIDARTMEIHHTKHHQAYVNGLNTALEALSAQLQAKDLTELLANLSTVPESVRADIDFHGGGNDSHNIFWNNMKSKGGGEAGGSVADAIKGVFGSFATFKEQLTAAATKVRGSGWTWLAYNPGKKAVEIKSMPNQTSPRTAGLLPLLGIDVWEHAYYLKYQNRRPEYIAAWWSVVNWDDVEKRYKAARG